MSENPIQASLRFYNRYGQHTIPHMPLIMAMDDLMRAWLKLCVWWVPAPPNTARRG